jgi:NAD(P)-dependent dehydrogenase (short-subunit alcohol dehydrogenase family)
VNPGVVVTEIHKRGGMNEGDYEQFLERSKTTHPLGRVGQASEIAELVFYLASEKASWITGGTYSIDGGRALTCAR